MLSRISLACLLWFFLVGSAFAQGDFFFSFTEGGLNTDQTMDFVQGSSGSLWVYWSTNGPANSDLRVGAFIDVFSSTDGVIEFTAAETFDYRVRAGFETSSRLLNGGWGYIGPAQSVAGDFIDEMAAFTVTGGDGILESNNGSGTFLDLGYDANSDGFQWGRIDFDVVGTAGSSTAVTGASGDGLIVNEYEVVPAIFTSATINVVDAVPEPSTAGLLCLAFAGIGIRRKR